MILVVLLSQTVKINGLCLSEILYYIITLNVTQHNIINEISLLDKARFKICI